MEQKPEIKSNVLYYGDNLIQMQDTHNFPDGSVDLTYVDSQFSEGIKYLLMNDEKSQKEHKVIWKDGVKSYIEFMTPRLQEMYRILYKEGTIYIHCDHHASHYLKVVMDKIFGEKNFRTEINWMTNDFAPGIKKTQIFPFITQSILVYTKSNKYTHNHLYIPYTEDEKINRFHLDDNDGRGRYYWENKKEAPPQSSIDNGWIYKKTSGKNWKYKCFLNDSKGHLIGNVWNNNDIVITDDGRILDPIKLHRNTVKPEQLLERIILTSTNIEKENIVFDPFCGSGTTCVVAKKLGRKFIGIDYSSYAIHLSANRLEIPESQIIGMPQISVQIPEIETKILDEKEILKMNEEIKKEKNDISDTIRVLQDYKSPFKNIIRESNIQREEGAALSMRFTDVIAEEQNDDSRPDITRTNSKIAIEEKNNASYWTILEKIGKYLDYVNYKYVIFSLHKMKGTKEDFEKVKSQLRLQLKIKHQKNIYFINDSELSTL